MVVNGRFIVVVLWTIENPKPLVDNQSDIFSHFLDMSCNEQAATDKFSSSSSGINYYQPFVNIQFLF